MPEDTWRLFGWLLEGNSSRYVLREVILFLNPAIIIHTSSKPESFGVLGWFFSTLTSGSLALRNLGSPESLKLALLTFLLHKSWLIGIPGFHFCPLSCNHCSICSRIDTIWSHWIQEEKSHLKSCILSTLVCIEIVILEAVTYAENLWLALQMY